MGNTGLLFDEMTRLRQAYKIAFGMGDLRAAERILRQMQGRVPALDAKAEEIEQRINAVKAARAEQGRV